MQAARALFAFGAAGVRQPSNGHQMTVRRTGTLLRVAFEYGHT